MDTKEVNAKEEAATHEEAKEDVDTKEADADKEVGTEEVADTVQT